MLADYRKMRSKDLKKGYLGDEQFKLIYKTLCSGKSPPKNLEHQYKHHDFKDGLLTYSIFPHEPGEERLCEPINREADVIHDHHDALTAGHLGYLRPYELVRRQFYWPKIFEDSRDTYRDVKIVKIQVAKSRLQALLHPLPISEKNGKGYRWISSQIFALFERE